MTLPVVRWDNTLPPLLDPESVEGRIARWDDWFAAVGLLSVWNLVKLTHPNDLHLQLMWANVIELNRIQVIVDKAKTGKDAADETPGADHQRTVEKGE